MSLLGIYTYDLSCTPLHLHTLKLPFCNYTPLYTWYIYLFVTTLHFSSSNTHTSFCTVAHLFQGSHTLARMKLSFSSLSPYPYSCQFLHKILYKIFSLTENNSKYPTFCLNKLCGSSHTFTRMKFLIFSDLKKNPIPCLIAN